MCKFYPMLCVNTRVKICYRSKILVVYLQIICKKNGNCSSFLSSFKKNQQTAMLEQGLVLINLIPSVTWYFGISRKNNLQIKKEYFVNKMKHINP